VLVHLPTPLRQYAGQRSTLEVQGSTVADVMRAVIAQYPDLKSYLYSDDGNIRGFVNIYLNDEDIRYLPAKENAPVKQNDTLTIMPSIAGGV